MEQKNEKPLCQEVMDDEFADNDLGCRCEDPEVLKRHVEKERFRREEERLNKEHDLRPYWTREEWKRKN
jgi:hypothetical protein